jgi:hypothetical protein
MGAGQRLTFNLSLIMRKLTGVGTPRQAAAARAAFWTSDNALRRLMAEIRHLAALTQPDPDSNPASLPRIPIFMYSGR